MPWANGLGTTKEIVVFPTDGPWLWRLSLADVVAGGPFSILASVDRSLVVASGAGMLLTVGDQLPFAVRTHEHVAFPGDSATSAELIDGPVRDLNLMVRRDAGIGRPHLDVRRVPKGSDIEMADAVALVVLDGALRLTVDAEGFPYTPLRCRVGRFDAVLPGDDGVHERLATVAESVVVFAFLRSVDGRPD